MRNIEPSRPTIENVAKVAGVSTATVSRVLNRPDSVSDALRGRVLETVLRLGYVPDAGARALKLQRSGTVGAIFPTMDSAIFAQAIEALQDRFANAGLQLLIATCGYDVKTEERQAMNLVTRGADALVLCGVSQSPKLLQFLKLRELPVVHAMSHPPAENMISVGFDNARVIGQAVRYLLDLGHTRFAMMSGTFGHNDRAIARVDGVRRTLAMNGIELPPHRVLERKYALSDAREGFRVLMTSVLPRPTALICGNDVLAFGALLEAESMGIMVPKEVSIVGFADLEMARHIKPALTTLHVPMKEMWETVADRVIASLQKVEVQRTTEFDVSLVVRASTGPAPAKAE